jgi:ectoine hydroxylase
MCRPSKRMRAPCTAHRARAAAASDGAQWRRPPGGSRVTSARGTSWGRATAGGHHRGAGLLSATRLRRPCTYSRMANRQSDAQRIANQATQLQGWGRQLCAQDSTVQQLALLRGLVADGSSPDATEWLLERILKHAPPVGAAQGTSAPATKQEILSELPVEHLKHLLTNEERRAFETDGVSTPTAATLLCFCCVLPPADLTWARAVQYFVVRQALPQPLVAKLQGVLEDLEAEYRPRLNIAVSERLNLIDCVSKDARLLELLDYPTVLPKVWGLLGWNIQLYLAQATVMPHTGTAENTHANLTWHRDSGRVNQEMQDHGGNPRVSLKVGYMLSNTSERTGFQVIPGTHLGHGLRNAHVDLCNGAPWDLRQGDPPCAVSLPLLAGDAVLFDRRVVHAQPPNPLEGEGLRKALFFGYSYRWLRPRDESNGLERFLDRSGPIRRQLLGAGPTGARGYTSPLPEDVPLRTYMEAHGFGGLGDGDPLRTFTADDLAAARL